MTRHTSALSRHLTRSVRQVGVTATLVLSGACGQDVDGDDDDDGCGPNSSFSEEHDHCHCDDGFEIVGTACLAIEDDDDDGGGEAEEIDLQGAVITGQSLTDDGGDGVYMLQAVAGDVVLRLEGYVGFGAPESGPASVTLSGDELNYATCAVCVLVQTGCAAHDDHFHCSQTLMPASGSVVFSTISLDDALAGHLHELRLQPVEIASDYQTTPVEGAQFTLSHWEFSTSLSD